MSNGKQTLDELAVMINLWANGKGFWDVPTAIYEASRQPAPGEIPNYLKKLVKSQKIMLVVTELAELVEGLRKPVDSSIPPFTNEEEEIADAIIRLLDYCGEYELNIHGAVLAKMAYNQGRPYQHGKAF